MPRTNSKKAKGKKARDRSANTRLCFGCGIPADTSCTACDSVFMCRDCPATLGMERCEACAKAGRPSVREVVAPERRPMDESQAKYVPKTKRFGSMPESKSAVCTPDSCGYCGSPEGPFKKCQACKNAIYCSRECQKSAWPTHKKNCAILKERRKAVRAAPQQDAVNSFSDASGVGSSSVIICPKPGKSVAAFFKNDMVKIHEVRFSSLDECEPWLRFLLACGPVNDLAAAKQAFDLLCRANVGYKVRVPGAGFTALEWAARKGNYDIAEWLATDPRSRPLLREGAPVGWALYTNRVKLARMLVAQGADAAATDAVFFRGRPPLLVAASNGHLLAMQYLVDELGHDIRTTDGHGRGILATISAESAGASTDVKSKLAAAMEGMKGMSMEKRREAANRIMTRFMTAQRGGSPNGRLQLSREQAACATWARRRGAVA